jgi:hypothetical protein
MCSSSVSGTLPGYGCGGGLGCGCGGCGLGTASSFVKRCSRCRRIATRHHAGVAARTSRHNRWKRRWYYRVMCQQGFACWHIIQKRLRRIHQRICFADWSERTTSIWLTHSVIPTNSRLTVLTRPTQSGGINMSASGLTITARATPVSAQAACKAMIVWS